MQLPERFIQDHADLLPPWGEVGYVTYKRTYARKIEELGRTEEWHEHCGRLVNGLLELGAPLSMDDAFDLYKILFEMKGSVSGRAHWQLGTETVRRVGSDSLQNCWLCATRDLEAFCFTFDELMLGGGVGYNIQAEHVYELPPVAHSPIVERVETPDCDFVVPDNREGWVQLLRLVLQSFFHTGRPLRYSTQMIRPAGRPIIGFGGVASGSESLVKGISQIVTVLRSRYRRKLRPVDCLDIMNIIGSVVVSGNVRRSAQIALGDPHDTEYLKAKMWSTGSIPNWRAMSNNSIIAPQFEGLPDLFWDGYHGGGEPYGLINLDNCRRFGRLIDGPDYRPDYDVVGVNPCAEITLCDREPCNLAEIYLPNIKSMKEFRRVAELLYVACKTISSIPFSNKVTHDIVQRNHRIGIGLTGWMAAEKWRDPQKINAIYNHLEACDEEYSKRMGLHRSIKLTTMKPSGTLSLLPWGVPPGMHAAFGQYLIRRIRFSANDPIVDTCRSHGYHVEPQINLDGTYNHDTLVVDFPMSFPDTVVTEDQMTAVGQLEEQKFLQTYWSDNAVSATHYFRPEELSEVQKWMNENYTDGVKTASFLPTFDHGFKQAPLEKVSREHYMLMKANTRPITSMVDSGENELVDSLECAGGHCPVK